MGGPAQNRFGLERAGLQPRHVSGATLHDVIRNGLARGRFEAFHHIQNAQAVPGADVQGQMALGWLLKQVIRVTAWASARSMTWM